MRLPLSPKTSGLNGFPADPGLASNSDIQTMPNLTTKTRTLKTAMLIKETFFVSVFLCILSTVFMSHNLSIFAWNVHVRDIMSSSLCLLNMLDHVK